MTLLPALTGPLLVTGAGGFVGARFVERANARKIPLVSVDDPSYFTARKELSGLDFGTIVDREKLFDWLEAETARLERPPVTAIVHLGACTDTMELDEEYLAKMNLDYTKRLWAYCAKRKVPFVYASSAATYGAGEFGYDDDDTLTPKLKPLNPYGESKRAFDEWAFAQEERDRAGEADAVPPSWAGFKFFNVYGYGEDHKGKMASVILHAYRQILATGGAKLFQSHKEGIKDGEQSRDFVFVEDVVDVLFFALEKPIRRGVYNLGSGKARTFLDLVRATFHAMGKPERIEFVPTPESLRERYQYFTEAKMDRLRNQGFTKPFTSLENGVAAYVERLKSGR
ncbi:MAG: ADP-glyceromanno-heptose 6-epimerase [Bdellovibrionales bacterium]|nr:ADP-glyceromanno-heptose 6-epimerase [Bdellovibrionales bacterium]